MKKLLVIATLFFSVHSTFCEEYIMASKLPQNEAELVNIIQITNVLTADQMSKAQSLCKVVDPFKTVAYKKMNRIMKIAVRLIDFSREVIPTFSNETRKNQERDIVKWLEERAKNVGNRSTIPF